MRENTRVSSVNGYTNNNGIYTPCLEWTRTKTPDGYGHFSHKGVCYTTHRVSYWLEHGPIKPGMYICHLCNNPACCNPYHLVMGSPQQNTQYAIDCGRMPGERMTPERLQVALQMRSEGKTYSAIAQHIGLSTPVVWDHIKRHNA